MKKLDSNNIVILITTLGLLIWIITGFYSGMYHTLVTYWMLIIPCIILYLYSVIGTLSSFFKRGLKENLIKLFSIFILIVAGIALSINNSELFKSDIILRSILRDDLSNSILTLRKDGKCEIKLVGLFGYSKKSKNLYIFKGDTIIFLNRSCVNNFPPDTLLLDTMQKAIFFERDESGAFRTKKEWLNHYKIE